jgi:hypothetical protein
MKLKFLLPTVVTIILFSCEKQSDSETTIEGISSVNLETALEESETILDDAALYSGYFFGVGNFQSGKGSHKGHSGYFSECVEMESTEDGNTITTVITFTENCLDREGNAITGTLTRVETVTDTSSENTLTIEDLTINGYIINGTKTFTLISSNTNGNPEMSGTVILTVTSDEGTLTKEGTRTVEITAGGETDSCTDDEKTITGSFTFTNFEGTTVGMEITTPLVKPAECRYIASGIKTYTTSEGTATLDFGDGTCDEYAIYTDVDGTVTEITLGKHHGRKH